MWRYPTGEAQDSSISFGFMGNQFSNIEIVSVLDRMVESREDANWSMGVGGSVYAAPLVHGGVIYFGSCDKNFYAIDAETGKEIWKFPVGGVILSTAAIDSGIIYFGCYDGCMYAVSLDGRLVWKFDTGDKINCDPLVWKDAVYFGSRNGNIYAVEKSSGRLVWKLATNGPISSSAAIGGGVLYIGSNDKNLYAIDAETGRMIWKFPANGAVRYKIAVWDGKVIFGSLDGNMRAVDAQGRLLWRFQARDGIGTMPRVFGNALYFGSRDMNLYKLDGNGRLVWRYRARGYPNDSIVIDGHVYFGCCENDLYVLDDRTGSEMCTMPTNGFVVQFAWQDGRIFFGSWGCSVYSATPEGKLLWRFDTSMSTQAPVEPEEGSKAKLAEVVWRFEEESQANKPDDEVHLADYGTFSGTYIDATETGYLGVRKKGYRS